MKKYTSIKKIKFSKIRRHKLREYWKNEATDFSLWLSKGKNLKLLSETIGIKIEFIKREATKNSRLRVDILAKDSETEETIIIENQLEETDHNHLGKLVTYASIFNSNKIIWIVSDIRKEHELAINWLNDNSKSPINLFLVRIELISIDNSGIAPIFTVISKPKNHNLPKILEDFDTETIDIIKNHEKLEENVLDPRIIDFFNLKIELNVKYSKLQKDKKYPSLFEKLKKYNIELYLKYSVSNSRDFKTDLYRWCEFYNYQINKKYYEKTGKRDYKSNGIEFFEINN